MSLRVTPIYGSQYNIYGASEEPTCTFIEFSNCRIIVNIGYNPTYWNNLMNDINETKNSNSNVDNDDDDETMKKEKDKMKKNIFPDHDCVFIMNSTWQCIGGLPIYYDYMLRRYQQQQHSSSNTTTPVVRLPPIYTTYPTIKMGQMTIYDYHAMLAMDGHINTIIPYTLSSIDNVFASIIPIKYNQHIYITPSSSNDIDTSLNSNSTYQQQQQRQKQPSTNNNNNIPQLSITAHRAGYVVGASYYVIQRLIDETIILYTDSTYHMSKEIHLEPCTLLQQQSSSTTTTTTTTTTILPDVLITRPGGPAFRQFRALYTNPINHNNSNNNNNNIKSKSLHQPQSQSILPPPPLVQQAERNLMETIMAVLRRDGNVILPVDTSGRILELLLLLVKEWDMNKYYTSYNLIYYGYMCHNVIDYAKSQLEWMSQPLNTQFTDHGQHPYRFANTTSTTTTTTSTNKKMIHFCTSMSELNNILEQDSDILPSCIISSGLSMEGGPSRDVLLKFADNPDNAIVFTDSSQCYLRRTYYNSNTSNTNSMTSSSSHAPNANSIVSTTTTTTTTALSSTTEQLFNEKSNVAVPQQDLSLLTNPTTIVNNDSAMNTTPLVGPNIVGLDNTNDTNDEENDDDDDDVTNIGEALNVNETKSIWTTAGQLLQAWATAKAMGTEMADSIIIDVNVPIRAPLSGQELKLFLEQEEAKRQEYIKAAEKRAMLAQVELAKGQLHLGEDDTTTTTTIAPSITTSMTKDNKNKGSIVSSSSTMVSSSTRSRPKKKSRFDSTLFLKFSKPLYMTFDVREEAVGLGQPDSIAKYGIGESVGRSGEILEDDYGISVQPHRFTDIVSGVDPSKFASGTGRIGDDPTRRRGFGYDTDISSSKNKSKASSSSNLSRIVSDTDDQDDDVDALDEQVQEALDLSEGTGIIRGRNGRLPTKVSTVIRKLEVLAEISYIPGLEGRVDARAARQSVRALQPREVIVLGGSRNASNVPLSSSPINLNLISDEVRLLADAAKSFVKGSKIVTTPSDGETVELYVGHAAYTVRLIEKPYVPPNMMDVEREIPESIETVETKLGSCNVSRLNCVATGQKVALDGSIVLAPQLPTILDESKAKPSIYLSDGEILLTDLRTELIALGMKAEYSAHTGYSQLLINGKIVLKKEQSLHDSVGRMHIEGPLCEDFYTVRSILSGQFVVL